uniref:Ig-like domain-containing protein n=1 Tax=Romanomermis culicivorax TaxID=13658 RepID=A0A915JIG0_ROMCU
MKQKNECKFKKENKTGVLEQKFSANEHISNHLEHDELVINRKYATNETHKETKREGDDMVLFCEYTVAGGSATANRLPESFEWRHNGV